ncbi:hypothetical protein SB4_04645 [Sphingomonas sanguinis]|uniref:Uncharacterized protein n=1 Tax=Sphingomonas sanguinis TaxID=33051 RepID=A0A147J0Z9_9SPHN|nr:hypothetical protein SB4_04645 [Sphingomonas sanguinis]
MSFASCAKSISRVAVRTMAISDECLLTCPGDPQLMVARAELIDALEPKVLQHCYAGNGQS